MNDKCEKCGAAGVELCQDGYCRDCHVSLSFEDCVSGEWVRRERAKAGLPNETPATSADASCS